MKILAIWCLIVLSTVSAQAVSDPIFLSCQADNNMQLTMSFDPAEKLFTYVLTEDGLPRGFHARPEPGFGFDHSSVSYAWTSTQELRLKAQILGGTADRPRFLYSADVKLKDLGLGQLKLESIEVYYREQSQRLIWFNGQSCKAHQGFP